VVDYRVKDDKVYISNEGAKEYKCAVEATLQSADQGAPEPQPATYQKGTIEGFSVRRDVHVSGGGGSNGGTVFPVGSSTRKAKVYELRGPDLIYQVDYCGAFQAGQFTPGQVVEYRVSGDRLYIRHDGDKEYNCQLEGTRVPDGAKPPDTPPAAAASPQPNKR
jgi:hypothetical protein